MHKNKELKKNTNLDIKDKKILFELDFNARKTDAEIAKKVGLSKQGVDYKIQNMVKKKIILGFYPVINIMALGYIYGRIFIKFQNLTKDAEKEIIEKVNKKFRWNLRLEGSYDLGISI